MNINKKQKLILASCSPRRRELIKLLGMDFECISVDADESTNEIIPSKAVQEISAKKARAALSAHKISLNEVIIGADTVVVFDNKYFVLTDYCLGENAERVILELDIFKMKSKKNNVRKWNEHNKHFRRACGCFGV